MLGGSMLEDGIILASAILIFLGLRIVAVAVRRVADVLYEAAKTIRW